MIKPHRCLVYGNVNRFAVNVYGSRLGLFSSPCELQGMALLFTRRRLRVRSVLRGMGGDPPGNEPCQGRPPASSVRGSRGEGVDEGRFPEKGFDDPLLDAPALTVDDPDLPESFFVALLEIVFEEHRNFFGPEGVKIDPVFDGNADNHKKSD
jgi:hypothetical protein